MNISSKYINEIIKENEKNVLEILLKDYLKENIDLVLDKSYYHVLTPELLELLSHFDENYETEAEFLNNYIPSIGEYIFFSVRGCGLSFKEIEKMVKEGVEFPDDELPYYFCTERDAKQLIKDERPNYAASIEPDYCIDTSRYTVLSLLNKKIIGLD